MPFYIKTTLFVKYIILLRGVNNLKKYLVYGCFLNANDTKKKRNRNLSLPYHFKQEVLKLFKINFIRKKNYVNLHITLTQPVVLL